MKTIEATKYCIFELLNRERKPLSCGERFIVGQDFFQPDGRKNVKQTTLQKTSRLCRRTLTGFKTFFLCMALLAGALASKVQAQVIQLITSPGNFYVDDKAGNGIVYNYAVYMISNNLATNIPSTYVVMTNIVSTNRILLATTDSGVRTLGALAAGQTKMAAFYLKGPSFTKGTDSLINLTNENHTIRVLNGPPGIGTVLASSNYGFSNITFVIEANANKVTIITNLNPYAVVGERVDLVIGGDTGTIGGQNSISFSPGVLDSWRPDAYELVSTVVRFTQNPTYNNRLYFDPGVPGFTNYSGQSYTNTFTFRALLPTGTNVQVSPFAFIDSGANIKHTTLTSLGSGGSNIIVAATNAVLISSQTITPSSILAPGGTVTYTITFSNTSSFDLVMDEINDILPGVPANITFIQNSATYNSLSLGNPNINGQTLRWPTPFPIDANSSSVLTFQATVPLTAGRYTNSATALIGATVIDSTLNTFDNAPSLSVLTVVPVADIGLGKTGPSNVLATSNFNYSISVTNFGPSPATGVAVTDYLPAGVTFVSASGGGMLSGGNVVWTNLGTLAANDVTNLTLTLTAPANGTVLTNLAVGTAAELDTTPDNNTNPPVITTVTSVADVGVSKTGPATSVSPGANFNYTITVTNSGPSVATSVTVTDSLPANVTFVSATGGGMLSGGDVIWADIGDLASGASTNLILTVTAPLSGSSTNVASVGGPTSDPNPTNNITPPVTTTVSNVPPVAVNDTAATTNTPVSIPVLENDSDPNGDTLTIVGVSFTNGTAVISGTNVIYTPDTNFTGYVTVGYTISDGNGGTNSAIITVAVGVVNQPPVAMNDSTNVVEDASVTIDVLANDSDPNGDALTIVSFVSTNGSVINTGTNLVFTPAPDFNGTVTILYTISDGFGGTNSAAITVTVSPDNDPPVAVNDSTNVVEDASVTIDVLANDSDVDGDTLSIVSFVSTNGTVINTGTNLVFAPDTNFNGTATILYTVSDGNGGTNSAVITITVSPENDPPVAVDDSYSVNGTTNLIVSATSGVLSNDFDVDGDSLTAALVSNPSHGTITLNGDGSFTFVPTNNYHGPDTFTYQVNDGTTTSAVATVTITIINDTPPVITCATNKTVECGDAWTFDAPTATSTCGTNVITVLSTTTNVSGHCGNTFDATRTWVATDECGNTNTCSQTVNVVDTTGPVITCATNKTVELGDAWTFDPPTASDGCGTNTIAIISTVTNFSGHCGNTFDATQTWVATDECGNTNTCSQTVNVADTTGPAITCATNKTVEIGTAWTFDPPTATDAGGTNAITILSTTTNVSGHCGNTFDATRTWVATDECGNTNTCSQTVTTVDTTGPAIACATNKTVEIGTAWTFDTPTATDAGGTNTITILSTTTNVSGHCGNTFDATRTWVATDECGNTNTCSQTVNVVDTTGPTITCVSGKNVECGSAWTFDVPSATDAGGTNVITILSTTTNVSGHCGNTFDATRTWVATDECGNTNTCSQTVNVVDTTGPAITCATNKTVEIGTAWTFDMPTATDGCGTNAITILSTTTNVSGHCGNTFDATRTWVATDECGNTNTCSQTVTTVDTTSPAITCATNKSVECGSAWTFDAPSATDAGGTNTISIVSTTTNAGCGNTFDATRTWSATDLCGNSNTCSQTVTVTDTTAPTITCPADVAVSQFSQVPAPDPATATATDNCGTPAKSFVGDMAVTNGLVVTITRTYAATDACGNSNTCSQTITVTSLSADVLVAKSGPSTILAGSAITYTISVTNNGPSTATNVVVTDNLPVSLVFSNASSGGVFSNGVVTWPGINLANGGFTNYTLIATAPSSGSFTNRVSGTSDTPDPDPSNNNGSSAAGQVTTTAVTPTFGVSAGSIVLNPQTGLYEQIVFVTNTTVVAVPGVRLNVTISRSGVSLYNATGTNAGVPYVQYNLSLASGEVLRFRLEFYNPSRLPFTDTLTAQAVTGSTATVSGGGVDIDRAFMDNRLSPTEIRFLIEFISTPGSTYTVVYSDEFPTMVWKVAVPSITANANRTQWYDDGPPKTDSRPSLKGGRYYRVIKN